MEVGNLQPTLYAPGDTIVAESTYHFRTRVLTTLLTVEKESYMAKNTLGRTVRMYPCMHGSEKHFTFYQDSMVSADKTYLWEHGDQAQLRKEWEAQGSLCDYRRH
jgi:hypothetical protein